MPRKGAAQRAHERQGLPPVKPGKLGWVHSSKLGFFQKHKDEFVAAAELNKTGAFYSTVAKRYLEVYGYNTAWNADLPKGQDVAADVDLNENINDLDAEEAQRRVDYYKILRSKIGVWYNANYGPAVQKKTMKVVTFRKLFDKPELDPPVPVKQRVLHFYSNNFYHEHIKARVVTRWAAVSRQLHPPALVPVWSAVTKEAWLGETLALRTEVEQAVEKEYAAAQQAYTIAMGKETPSTVEEYKVALNNAAFYLQPFADAARRQFGLNFLILMCGPIPNCGGRIEMRSIHSGFTNDLVPRTWSEYDRAGFEAVQSSFIGFTRHCFTENQCRERALNIDQTADDALSDVSLEENTVDTNAAGTAAPGSDTSDHHSDSDKAGASITIPGATGPEVPPPPPMKDVVTADEGPTLRMPVFPSTPPRTYNDDMGVDLSPSLPLEPRPNLSEIFGIPSTCLSMTELLEAKEPLVWDDSWFSNTAYDGPVIGDPLAAEIAQLESPARLEYMGRLGGMSAEVVKSENAQAEVRLVARTNLIVPEGEGCPEIERPKPKPARRGKAAPARAQDGDEDKESAEGTKEEEDMQKGKGVQAEEEQNTAEKEGL
ncbi:hypothetical protein K438DRAFT_1986374 [Mycena galopus ATCC 62051]|nr:hypothetical protein K438DRAFT_1986374 [Mycena galopus ATCC 62051]